MASPYLELAALTAPRRESAYHRIAADNFERRASASHAGGHSVLESAGNASGEPMVERTEFITERVDREAGKIHGVKLVGLKSANGRQYTERALQEAIALYEGTAVYLNHPKDSPSTPRDYQERIAGISNVVFKSGQGLFGDLDVNMGHPCAESVMWDAEKNTKGVGLSHNVMCSSRRDNSGMVTVESIAKVRSVDLVAGPATTASLFESAQSNADGSAPSKDDPTQVKIDRIQRDLIMSTNAQDRLVSLTGTLSGILSNTSLDDAKKLTKIADVLTSFDNVGDEADDKASSPAAEQYWIEESENVADWSPTTANKYRQLAG